MTSSQTVVSGLRMPAEWEPHEATWLAWPHNSSDWPGRFAPIHWTYVEIVRLLGRVERVEILVEDDRLHRRVRKMLADAGVDLERIGFHRCATDRSWIRDSGPTFVHGPPDETAAVCWRFNAWAKYSNWTRDVLVSRRVAEWAGCRPRVPTFQGERVVLEGGAIDVDGQGSLLTTEECLLSETQQRNPGMGRADYERVFQEFLGVETTLWLERGIAGDDTHGHVDDLARFVGPGRVATVVESDSRDENYAPLKRNRERLKALRDARGRALDVIELPMPRALRFRGVRLPASYANFYIANGLVIAPTFNDPNDRAALNALAAAFPDREVVGVHAVDLAWGFGTLHCGTQQQPAPPASATD